MEINVNGPMYCGAPCPKFKPKCINESCFEDGLRYKEYYAFLSDDKTSGEVEWLSQEDDYHTDSFDNEILRAFKANGVKNGASISVKFGSRDTGYIYQYVLTI